MPRYNNTININNIPSSFRGNVQSNGRIVQTGMPPVSNKLKVYRAGSDIMRTAGNLMYSPIQTIYNDSVGTIIDDKIKSTINTGKQLYKDFNDPSKQPIGPTFPFNIINDSKRIPQKQFAAGGRVPNIIRGGKAEHLGNNFYYMNGRKHSQGGIDIGKNPKTGIEVEDKEVVETNNGELKVYSAQPILNGKSPANLILEGANPKKIFNAQEIYKENNRINNDGTSYKNGGKTNNIININGNVKNGLLHAPSSTGSANKYVEGGKPPKANYNRSLLIPKANLNPGLIDTNRIKTDVARGNYKLPTNQTFGYGSFNNKLTTEDLIGAGSNLLGNIGSYIATNKAINNSVEPTKPTSVSAQKLKTNYNINPQLDKIREEKLSAYRDIDANTASSRVGLARKQKVSNIAGNIYNQLYGQKENVETSLINQDIINQQSVAMANTQQYNQYLDRVEQYRNARNENKASNINNLFSGINAGVQDVLGRIESRKNFNNTLASVQARNPNVDSRILQDAGVGFNKMRLIKKKK